MKLPTQDEDRLIPLFLLVNGLGRPGAAIIIYHFVVVLSWGTKTETMQQQDDLRALEKVVQFMRGISVLFAVTNIYWFCHG